MRESGGTRELPLPGTSERTFRACAPDRFDQLMVRARKTGTLPITCSLDGQAHDVTDECLRAGQRTGRYQALCGHLVSAAALATPFGRPCAECTTAVVESPQLPPTAQRTRRPRHRRPGWLWRILHSRRNTSTDIKAWRRS